MTLTGFTGLGVESFSVAGNTNGSTGILEALSISAFGQSFDLTNSLLPPNDPIIVFENGALRDMVWSAAAATGSLFITSNAQPVIADLRTGNNAQSLGELTVSPAPIPLPAGGVLLLSGLLVLAAHRRVSARINSARGHGCSP